MQLTTIVKKMVKLALALVVTQSCVLAQDRHALIIGVGRYGEDSGLSQLRFVEADAKIFAQFLESPGAGPFASERVHVLANGDATRRRIFEKINQIGRSLTQDSIVFVLIAGHGVEDDQGNAYYLPADADAKNPNALGIRFDHLYSEIRNRLSAKVLAVFVDACHSGSAFNQGYTRQSSDIANNLIQTWARSGDGPQVLGFFAAGSRQVSLEDEQLGHGLFTHYLVKGLRGDADADLDGTVTSGELANFVTSKVEQHAQRRFGKDQRPVTAPTFSGSIPLASTITTTEPTYGARGPIMLHASMNSRLMKDPNIETVRADLLRSGFVVKGYPDGTSYAIQTPGGVLGIGAHCSDRNANAVQYYRDDAREAADRVGEIVRKTFPDVVVQKLLTRQGGIERWRKILIERGQIYVEVCVGLP